MSYCFVPYCWNRHAGHRFPKDPERKKMWLDAIRRPESKPSIHVRICKSHFLESDYILPKDSVRKTPTPVLKPEAVPSRFHWTKPVPPEELIIENYKAYKLCAVPFCTNTTIQTPKKLFIHVPKSLELRQKWLQLAGRQDALTSTKYSMYFCEDHFDLPNDMENYMEFKLMGIVGKIRMTPHCLPSKFVCQQNQTLDSPPPKKKANKPTEKTEQLRDRSVRLRNKKAYLANRRCSVPHCNSRVSNEVSLHPCPIIPAVRNEWAEALKVSYQYVKNMVACSLHFNKIDFVQSKNAERVLKQNAVPSRNLIIRKRVTAPVNKVAKKVVPSNASQRQMTMTDTVDEDTKVEQNEDTRECRACLKKFDSNKNFCDVFQAWAPPWDGMEATIAEDLAKLANVEISISDRHSKVMCAPCYQKLLDAATFAESVRKCDLILRQRFPPDIHLGRVWPKPIQVDKNINGSVFNDSMNVEIKQEVVSDEEDPTNTTENPYVETELSNLDIKIEPEEFVEPPPMNITINGTISLDPLNSENKDIANGTLKYQEEEYLQLPVKQEPMSEEEEEAEQVPDLSLECLLCAKSFNSVSGLKAHVIAQHSYKTVKRKLDGSISPEKKRSDKHQCAICRRSFLTSTDLMVHETCHNKHVCYGCNEKFDSFEHLTRHRKRCKASITKSVQKPKTLEDVKRPLPDEKYEYLEFEIRKKEAECEIKNAIEMTEVTSEKKYETSVMEDTKTHTEDFKRKVGAAKSKEGNVNKGFIIYEEEVENIIKQEPEIENEDENYEDSDSNMKLHLEIHSTKSDTESTEASDTSMQLETLKNDENT